MSQTKVMLNYIAYKKHGRCAPLSPPEVEPGGSKGLPFFKSGIGKTGLLKAERCNKYRLYWKKFCRIISPQKKVSGRTSLSLAGVELRGWKNFPFFQSETC